MTTEQKDKVIKPLHKDITAWLRDWNKANPKYDQDDEDTFEGSAHTLLNRSKHILNAILSEADTK